MQPHLTANDKIMFYKYLDKAKIYLEFGSGGSTYQAAIRKNIEHIYSVESDKEWHIKLKDVLKTASNITFIYNEMKTIPNTWGMPGKNSTDLEKINYSNQIIKLDKSIQENIDLILIDGRFRVACCLKSFDLINDNCLIAFDDFICRREYHIVLDYYDIIDKTVDKRMVILKKKPNSNGIPIELIQKYEKIQL